MRERKRNEGSLEYRGANRGGARFERADWHANGHSGDDIGHSEQHGSGGDGIWRRDGHSMGRSHDGGRYGTACEADNESAGGRLCEHFGANGAARDAGYGRFAHSCVGIVREIKKNGVFSCENRLISVSFF